MTALTTRADDEQLYQTDSSASPAAALLLEELTEIISEEGQWLAQAQENERTMLAEWAGQSDDGRKWDKNYGFPVAPFDGCSDTRVRSSDAAVDDLSMLMVSAVFNAQPQAIQQEASDAAKAGKVGTLLKYEMRQRMHSELWEETNFLAQWMNSFGHAVMWPRWKQGWATAEETITIEQLTMWLADRVTQQLDEQQQASVSQEGILGAATIATEMAMMDASSDADAVRLLNERYPTLSEKRAARVMKDLHRDGVATFKLPWRKPGRPSVLALMPGIDIHYRWWTDKVNEAPVVYVIETLPEHKLRGKVLTEGWDAEFVEAVIKIGPQPAIDMGAISRNWKIHTDAFHKFDQRVRTRINRKLHDMQGFYQVVRAFVHGVDEDHIEVLHEVILHPGVPSTGKKSKKTGKIEPLVGKVSIVDDFGEGGPFVGFRREYKTRKVWESRGIPELGQSAQWQVKKNRDGRIDRSDLATRPPIVASIRMGSRENERQSDLGIRPGGRVYSLGKDTPQLMQIPDFRESSVEVDMEIAAEFADLVGREHANLPPGKIQQHRQFAVTGFLVQFREVGLRILKLDQKYMDPLQVSRVTGSGEMPFSVTREEIAGQFDVNFQFDVRMLDLEFVKARWNVIREAMANDRSGVMRDPVFTRWVVASIDPTLADMGFDDPQGAAQKDVKDLRDLLTAAMKGFYSAPPDGANARAMLDELNQQMQTNPHFAAQLQQDPRFAEYVQAVQKKYVFDLEQFDNAEKGRTGWTFDDAADRAGAFKALPS